MEQLFCKTCNQFKPVKEFQQKNGKIVSKIRCNHCKRSAHRMQFNSSRENIVKNRLQHIKHRCKSNGTPFDLDAVYVLELYHKQNDKCFYTDIPLSDEVKEDFKRGVHRDATSIDRVVPERGYVKGNVVLCLKRINYSKSDLTLEEMKLWMPEWHRRIVSSDWLKVGL